MEDLTSAQGKALDYIKQAMNRHGSAPTLRELCQYMGYKAIGSAQDVIAALRKKGYLAATEKQAARAFVLTEKAKGAFDPFGLMTDMSEVLHIPCLGSVPAGHPLEAVEERVDTMRVSLSLLPRPKPKAENLFALQTSGLSMIGAGILDKDWLIVNCQNEAEPGSIVIARMDGDVTCKRLMREGRSEWYLKPENPVFKPIYASETPFEIVGKVVALQRSLN